MQIGVIPSKTYTTNYALKRFPPEVRECYMDEEIQLKYLKSSFGFRYSMKNCLYDIVIEYCVKNSSCFFHIAKMDDFEVMLHYCYKLSLSTLG